MDHDSSRIGLPQRFRGQLPSFTCIVGLIAQPKGGALQSGLDEPLGLETVELDTLLSARNERGLCHAGQQRGDDRQTNQNGNQGGATLGLHALGLHARGLQVLTLQRIL